MIFRSASPFLGGYGGFGGYGLGYGLGGIGYERPMQYFCSNNQHDNISYHVELIQMLQVHICSPKPSLHPTLWLRLWAVVSESAWLCLVVPESTRQQYLQVPGKAWLCLIEPACNVPGTAWQLSFLFHSFLFLVIIHKIVMKLSNTDVG